MQPSVPPGADPAPPPPAVSRDDEGDDLARGFLFAALADRTGGAEAPWEVALGGLTDGLRGTMAPAVARLVGDAPTTPERRRRLVGALRAMARERTAATTASWPLPAATLRPGWQPPPGLRALVTSDGAAHAPSPSRERGGR